MIDSKNDELKRKFSYGSNAFSLFFIVLSGKIEEKCLIAENIIKNGLSAY